MKKWAMLMMVSCGLMAGTITTVTLSSEKDKIRFEHPEDWTTGKSATRDPSVYMEKDEKKCWYFCWWMKKPEFTYDEMLYWSDDLMKQTYPGKKMHSTTLSIQQKNGVAFRKYSVTDGDIDRCVYVCAAFIDVCRAYFVIETNSDDAIDDMNYFFKNTWTEPNTE